MSEIAHLADYIDTLSRARVLVVGDVMLDRFLTGEVERISPEGPIPVLRITREVEMLGGAGNVLRNLAALGVRGHLVAAVGEDPAGARVRELLVEECGGGDGVQTFGDRPTSIKERYIASAQQLLRVDRESLDPLSEASSEALIDAATEAMPEGGVLVLSDYGKGVLGDQVLRRLTSWARALGTRVLVDPKGRDFARYRGATYVTPNRRELHEATGLPVDDDASAARACERLVETAGVAGVLATRSEQGMTLLRAGPGASPIHLKAEAREVFDVSGAGDTVVAAFAAGLGAGLEDLDAARLANIAAGIVVGKAGTAVAHGSEILHALHASDLLAGEAKVVDLETAMRSVARWRGMGLKVGFTNGCFDLLHPGHVALLRQARSLCDRLIVGLNSDTSVRRLKGERRPVQGEAARAVVLASLESVSRVVVFAEDTPMKLLEAIRPDVLVKGADYKLEEVVGYDLVAGYGGEVRLVSLEPGHSTTRTIERLAR